MLNFIFSKFFLSFLLKNSRNCIISKKYWDFKKKCHIVLLKATLEEIYKRIEKDGKDSRPIINKNVLKREIKEVLNYREQYYYNAAEIVIDTSNKTIQNIVKKIKKEGIRLL